MWECKLIHQHGGIFVHGIAEASSSRTRANSFRSWLEVPVALQFYCAVMMENKMLHSWLTRRFVLMVWMSDVGSFAQKAETIVVLAACKMETLWETRQGGVGALGHSHLTFPSACHALACLVCVCVCVCVCVILMCMLLCVAMFVPVNRKS